MPPKKKRLAEMAEQAKQELDEAKAKVQEAMAEARNRKRAWEAAVDAEKMPDDAIRNTVGAQKCADRPCSRNAPNATHSATTVTRDER